jgi:arginine/lysine/ornithine decarboxylase
VRHVLFDEAWASFMVPPAVRGCFSMGQARPESPGHATQSTPAARQLPQASPIHVKDRHIQGQVRRVEHRRFNETF